MQTGHGNRLPCRIIKKSLIYKKAIRRKIPLVLNLCDGDEINGTPGVSVIHELEKCKLVYTGSDAHYYNITTSKIPMKKAFDEAGVSNAKWEDHRWK